MKNVSKTLSLALLVSLVSMSCENGIFGPKTDINDPNAAQGNLTVSITDAPIDNAEVKGAFVTITEVKIDGQVFNGFKGPKTVNVLELQNGNALNLGQNAVAADSYSKISFVLDSEKDAASSGPGCYVLKSDGTKEKLEFSSGTQTEIEMKPQNFVVSENGNTEIVVDFDLRKAIKSNNSDYSFVSKSELSAAVRAENKSNTGMIKGKVENYGAVGSNVVVYVYKKGTFNQSSEIKGQGSSDIKFANAVTSSKCDGSGNFTLAFLQQGEYEVYCDKPKSGSDLGLGVNTLLEASSSTNLKAVGVGAGAQTSLSLSIKIGGVLGL